MAEPEITIGACWDGRDYYPPEYVNRLFSSCLRHTAIPFDFVLYVGPEAGRPGRLDAIDSRIRVVPTGLPYWWGAMHFWRADPPGIRTEKILYMDLDQVIVGSLDELIRYPSDHAGMKDHPASMCPIGKETDVCTSTMLIKRGAAARVWEIYEAAGKPAWNPIGGHGPLPMATQGIINKPGNRILHDSFPENWVCSYKDKVRKRGLPEGCRIVAFHGRPKPHEVDLPWVKENWR